MLVFLDSLEKGVFESSVTGGSTGKASSGALDSTIACRRYEERAKSIRADLEATLEIKKDMAKIKKDVADRDASLSAKAKVIEDLQWKIKKLEHRISTLEKEVRKSLSPKAARKLNFKNFQEKEIKETTESKLQMSVSREKTLEEQNQSLQKLVDTLSSSNKDLTTQLASLGTLRYTPLHYALLIVVYRCS